MVRVSRRQLLAGVGAGALGISRWVPDGAPRVAIVGGGLAGLTCAYRLAQRGIASALYDARERVGGRCFTARGFSDGQVAEHGGEFIDSAHLEIRALARELGVGLEDRYAAEAGGVEYDWVAGRRRRAGLLDHALGPVISRLVGEAARVGDYSWRGANRRARELDEMTAQEWLDGNVDGGIGAPSARLMAASLTSEFGLDADRLSALSLVDLYAGATAESDERYHVRGGNDQLAALLARGHARVELGAPLIGLRRLARGYELRFHGLSARRAEVVVLALPFTALRRVDLSGAGLSARKLRCIAELGMGTNAKLLVQLRVRPEALGGWSGESVQDEPELVVWESTRAQRGAGSVLTLYTGGRAGASYRVSVPHARAPSAVVERAFGQLDRVVPGARQAWNGHAFLDSWVDDRWARGSYAAFLPGQLTRYWGFVGRSDGDVHFAGEHTSTRSQGFLNGAVESGERAAREVARKLA